jgi:hypothetical protein
MYPQCRHVLPSSDRCHAAAIKGGHWCYYHARLHFQQTQRQAQESARRSREARSKPRLTDGTFAPPEEIIDQESCPVGSCPVGSCPVGSTGPARHPEQREAPEHYSAETIPLELPAVEDSASIQLALIQVVQALASNQLDPRRAGLLLYGLQVASANAKKVHIHSNSIRSISYTSEGIPLATQEHGWDVEDIEEAAREEEEEYEDED